MVVPLGWGPPLRANPLYTKPYIPSKMEWDRIPTHPLSKVTRAMKKYPGFFSGSVDRAFLLEISWMGATIGWWKTSLSQLNSWRICLGIQKIWNYLLGAGFQTFERVPVSPLLKGFFGAIILFRMMKLTPKRLIEMMLLRKLRHLCWEVPCTIGSGWWWKAIWGGNRCI